MSPIRDSHQVAKRHRSISTPIKPQAYEEHETVTRSRLNLSNFYLSLTITALIILVQVFLFYYYYIGSSEISSLYQSREWDCSYPGLSEVYNIAQEVGVDLVVIDPDLLDSLDNNNKLELKITFSESRKRNQESTHKSIIHLAAINETSGGQPNLKLFFNLLKIREFVLLNYDDTSQLMQPEVYHRAPHLFDDMPLDGVKQSLYRRELNSLHSEELNSSGKVDNEISKIYTEFIAHIFILNNTGEDFNTICGKLASPFIVLHILVLYNYEYSPINKWIQPALTIDEIEKHKLLNHNVHSFDFRIPTSSHVHEKREIVTIARADNWRKRSGRLLERIRVFQPKGNRMLNFINNSYLNCKTSKFHIGGLSDENKKLSNYLAKLDLAKPLPNGQLRNSIQQQFNIAFKFLDTFSRAYNNFSHWITGSTLLAYYKYCDLMSLIDRSRSRTNYDLSDSNDASQYDYSSIDEDVIINLELGLFASEVNERVMKDLSKAKMIGVEILTDWRKSDSFVSFRFRDCPNLMFNLYPYELKKDFYQFYYTARNTMTMQNKYSKKSRNKQPQVVQVESHHVFNTDNLDLCLTRVDNFHPFKVPCNVHDHLRRIYII